MGFEIAVSFSYNFFFFLVFNVREGEEGMKGDKKKGGRG